MSDYLQDITTGVPLGEQSRLQEDTAARLNQIFSEKPYIAQPMNAGTGQGPTYNPNVQTPKTAEDVMSMWDNQTLNNPAYKNASDRVKTTVPYDQISKYADDFILGRDNEDYYAQKYQAGIGGFLKGVGKMIGRFGVGAVAKTGESLGYLGGMLNPGNWDSNFFLNIADNGFAKMFEKLDTKGKDWLIPVYQEATDRDKGFWGRFFTDSTFWTNDFADGAAFMASAFVPGVLETKVLNLGEKAVALADFVTGASKGNKILSVAEDATKIADYMRNAQRIKNVVDKGTIFAMNTASEAMFEGKGVADTVYQQALKDGKSDQEAKTMANTAAGNSFNANLLALSASNMWEAKLIGNILSKGENKLAAEGASKIALGEIGSGAKLAAEKGATRFERFWNSTPSFYAKGIAKGVAIEGVYEENIQLAIQRYNQNYKNQKNKGALEGFMDSFGPIIDNYFSQLGGAISGRDKEASLSIGLGGLLGGPFGVYESMHERNAEKKNATNLIGAINAAESQWTKLSQLYQTDENGNVIFANNKPVLDNLKISAVFNEQQANNIALEDLNAIVGNTEQQAFLKKQLFSKYFLANKNAGTDAKVFENLEDARKANSQTLLSIGIDPSANVNAQIDEYVDYAKKLDALHTSIDNDILIKNKEFKTKEDINTQMARKNYLYSLGASMLAANIETSKLEKAVLATQLSVNSRNTPKEDDHLVYALNLAKTRWWHQDEMIQQYRQVYKNDPYTDITDEDMQRQEDILHMYQTHIDELLQDENHKERIAKLKQEKLPSGLNLYKYESKDRQKDPEADKLQNQMTKLASIQNIYKENLETWYSYANMKNGFSNFKNKFTKQAAAINQQAEEAIQAEAPVTVQTQPESPEVVTATQEALTEHPELSPGDHTKVLEVVRKIKAGEQATPEDLQIQKDYTDLVEKLLVIQNNNISNNRVKLDILNFVLDGQETSDEEKAYREPKKPKFSLNNFYKTFSTHYVLADFNSKDFLEGRQWILNPEEYVQKFFKFTSTINLVGKNNWPQYQFKIVTKDNDDFGITFDETDVRLVIVKGDVDGVFKPVDIKGNILKTPTKEDLIYTSMAGDNTLLNGTIEEAYDYAAKIFTIDTKKEDIINSILAYRGTRKNVQQAIKDGKELTFPIYGKSGGIEEKEQRNIDTGLYPQMPLENRVVDKEMAPEDWRPVNLVIATTDTKNYDTNTKSYKLGEDGRLAPGRMAIRLPDGNHARVYNRKFTEEELQTVSKAILDYANLFYKNELTTEEESTKNRLKSYVEAVLYWTAPNEKDAYISPKRIWFSFRTEIHALHIGEQVYPFSSLDQGALVSLLESFAPYHQVNKKQINELDFYTPTKSGWKKWDSYKQYLMSSEAGTRQAPLYVNIIEKSNDPSKSQLSNVYLRYAVPEAFKVKVAVESPANVQTNPKLPSGFDLNTNLGPTTGIQTLTKVPKGQVVEISFKTAKNTTFKFIVEAQEYGAKTLDFNVINSAGDNITKQANLNEAFVNYFQQVDPSRPDFNDIQSLKDLLNPQGFPVYHTFEVKEIVKEAPIVQEAEIVVPNTETSTEPKESDINIKIKEALSKIADQLKGAEDIPDDVPFRLAFEDPIVVENIEVVKTWFANNLPQFPIEIVNQLIDNRAFGAFTNGLVQIYEGASTGTGFHEGFEAVWNSLLTIEEKESLIKEFRNRQGQFTNKFSGKTKSHKDASLYDVREMLAEDFIDFVNKDAKGLTIGQPKKNSFFRKLWNLIKSWLGLSNSQKESLYNSVSKVYDAINTGKFKDRIPTSFEGKTYRAIEGLDQYTTSLVLEGLHTYFFNNLKDTNIEGLLNGETNFELVNDLYSKARLLMSNRLKSYIAKNSERILTSGTDEEKSTLLNAITASDLINDAKKFKNAIVPAYEKYLTRFGIKFKKDKGNFVEEEAEQKIDDALQVKEEEAKDPLGIQDSMYSDPRNKASASVRLTIASLANMYFNPTKKEYLFRYNDIGMPLLVDYGKVMNTLINDLQGVTETIINGIKVSRFQNMMNKLDTKYKSGEKYKEGFEWIAMLKNRLAYENYDGSKTSISDLTDEGIRLRIAFEKSFANTKIGPDKIIMGPDGTMFSLSPIMASNERVLRETWLNNAKINTRLGSKVYVENNTRLIINKQEVDNMIKAIKNFTAQERLSFLEALGIKLSIPVDEFVKGSENETALNNAVSSIIRVLENDDVKTFDDLFGRQVINGPLNILASIELKNNSETTSLQFYNPEGKTVYSITLNSYWSNVINTLSNITNRTDFIRLNPQLGSVNLETGETVLKTYQTNSKLLALNGILFDAKGNKRQDIEYVLLTGISNSNDNYGENTSDLTFADKIGLRMFYSMQGIYPTIINSDKSNEFGLKLGLFANYKNIGFINDIVKEIYLPYLEDELNSALEERENPIKIQYYHDSVSKLGHFRNIVNKTSKSLIDNILVGKADVSTIYTDVNVVNDIVNYIKATVTEKEIPLLLRHGVIERNEDGTYNSLYLNKEELKGSKFNVDPKRISYNSLVNLLTFYTVNEQASTIEQHKLIYGHPSLYKDLAKRSSGATSTKESIVEDAEILEWMNLHMQRLDGYDRLSDENGLKFRNISYKDVIAVSSGVINIAEKMYASYSQNSSLSKTYIEKQIGASFTDEGKFIAFTKGGAIKNYIELNEADAQAYIMPDYYRDLLFLSGKLSKEQKEQVDYEFAYERLYRSGRIPSLKSGGVLTSSSYMYKEYPSNILDTDILVYNRGTKGAIMPTLKPQYFGPQENDTLLHTTFLKHSAQPKFFREAEGTNFEKLYITSQDNQIDIIGFESGEKVGNVETDSKGFRPLYNEEGEVNIDLTEDTILPPVQILYSKFYGIQVEMAASTKDKVRRGSQMTKLILANLISRGVVLDDAIKDNIQNYINTLKDLINLGVEDLMDELGIKKTTDGYEVEDLSALITSLKREVESRDLPDNIIEALGVKESDPTQLKYKFDTLPLREKIDNILNSIADSRFISQKMNGKAAVQIASTLVESGKRDSVYLKDGKFAPVTDYTKLSEKEKESVRLTSNDLKFYSDENGKITGMEVKIPNFFATSLPKGTTLNLSEIDPRLLKAIGFRIPTQSLGQIENIIIKEFLPAELGDIVIVPTEIVGKAGSDFDIDKLNLLLPNFKVKKGKLIYIDPNQDIETIAKAEFRGLNGKSASEDAFFYALMEAAGRNPKEEEYVRSYKKKALENRLIEQMQMFLEIPSNYKQLITPNNADTLKGIRDEINRLKGIAKDENNPTDLSEFLKMAEVRERFVSSKVLVGIGAVHITSHTISQLGNIKLKGTYKTTGGSVKDITIRLQASDKVDGKFSLAHIENSEGIWITDLLSEAVTGFVDAAKDPFVFELNLNMDTAGTWFYLMKLGTPIEDIAFFHTQPIIEEYVLNKQASESMVNDINGKTLSREELKYKTIDKYYRVFFGQSIYKISQVNMKKARQLERANVVQLIEKYRENNPITSTADLKTAIQDLNKRNHSISKIEAAQQLAMLYDYYEYTEQAGYLSGFINSINYDTARTKNLVENILQSINWNRTIADDFIDNPQDALDNTFLALLKEKREDLQSMFKDFFVILNDKSIPFLERITDKLEGKEHNTPEFLTNGTYDPRFIKRVKADQKIDILNRFQNFFINYLIHTTKIVEDGKEFSFNQYYHLFRDSTNEVSLAKQLMQFKRNYPKNQALQELYPILRSDQGGTDNIKLFGTKMSTFENNVIIESFLNLYEMAKETGDKNLENFLKKIVIFSALQSGVQQSPISYTKALPTEIYSELVAKVIDKYTSDFKVNFNPDVLWKQFHQNNWRNSSIVERAWDLQDTGGFITLPATSKYVKNKFFLNSWYATTVTTEQDELRKNKDWDKLYGYMLYEYIGKSNGLFTYRAVNKLGNGMNMTEAYSDDSSERKQTQLPNNTLYGYIEEKTLNINSLTDFLPENLVSSQESPIKQMSKEEVLASKEYKDWFKYNNNPLMSPDEMYDFYLKCKS